MRTILLQDWITVQGTSGGGGVPSVTQTQGGWLDVSSFAAATFWIDVSQVTNPSSAANVVLTFQTSPTLDEAYFQPVAPPINPLTINTTPQVVQTTRSLGLVPLARYLRWKISTSNKDIAGTFGATFRIRVALSPESFFVPTDLGGCVLWLRGDMGITLNSGAVSGWADQSGQGNNAGQSLSANQMTYVPAGGAGGIAHLSGTSSTFMTGGLASSFTRNTIACVCSYSAGSVTYPGPFATTDPTYDVNSGAMFVYNTPVTSTFIARQVCGGSNLRDAGLTGTMDGNTHIHVGTNDTSITTYYRDGLSQATSSSISGVNTSSKYVVGALSGATANSWTGPLYEFLAYNRVLTAGELTRVTRYLAGRYGVAM
jgi:hypothetical protein